MSVPSTSPAAYEQNGKMIALDPGQPNAVSKATVYLTPAPQVSTASYAAVVGSTIDTLSGGQLNVSYQVSVATHTIDAKVQGSLDNTNWTDLITAVVIAGAASAILGSASPGAVSNYSAFRYYRVVIQDDSSGTHGTATVIGLAK